MQVIYFTVLWAFRALLGQFGPFKTISDQKKILLKSTWDQKHFVFQFGLEIAPARAVFTLKFDGAKNEILIPGGVSIQMVMNKNDFVTKIILRKS